jgi:hypothetical protein
MTGKELIARFEAGAIPEDSFHHADHLRLAFAYLTQFPPLEALERFCSALKRFAIARGKAELYHETITHAYFFLIRERMARCGHKHWEEFARGNHDLLVWKNGILSRYYSDETLKSDLARRVFIMPDKSDPGA